MKFCKTRRRQRLRLLFIAVVGITLIFIFMSVYWTKYLPIGQIRDISERRQPCDVLSERVVLSDDLGRKDYFANVTEKWITILTIERQHPELEDGGSWYPSDCDSVQRMAVILPLRDRQLHLRIMLNHMHPFLQRQNIAYTIFIIEQTHSAPFNRGMLLNIGFHEAMLSGNYNCVIFHDLDMLPEDHRIPYTCADKPRHMSEARSKHNYTKVYTGYLGGVISFPPKIFTIINGFSNAYFGWGTEDDDLRSRLKSLNYTILTVPYKIGRYKNVQHEHPTEGNFRRRQALYKSAEKRRDKDGLNSLHQGKMYKVLGKETFRLYTWFLVDINQRQTEKLLEQ